MPQKIYIISCAETSFLKIGVANDVNKRLSQLQGGCPFVLSVEYSTKKTKDDIARQVESRAHYILKDSHERGEWFDIELCDAISAIIKAKKQVLNKRACYTYKPRMKMTTNLGWKY